jgi:hypothetical protein
MCVPSQSLAGSRRGFSLIFQGYQVDVVATCDEVTESGSVVLDVEEMTSPDGAPESVLVEAAGSWRVAQAFMDAGDAPDV